MNTNIAQEGVDKRFGNGLDPSQCGKNGVKRRMEKKRQRQCFAEIAKAIVYNKPPIPKEQMETFAKICDCSVDDLTVAHTILAKQAQEAANGNIQSAVFLRDTIGEKPSETVNIVNPDFSALDSITWDDDDT